MAGGKMYISARATKGDGYGRKRRRRRNKGRAWPYRFIPNPFPNTQVVRMRLTGDPITIACTAVTYTQPANARWSANYLYDSFGTEQKAFGLTTLCSIYEHWTVVKSRLTVNVLEAGVLNGAQACLSTGSSANPGWTTIANQLESPGAKRYVITEDKSNLMTHSVNLAKKYGKTIQQMSFVKDLTTATDIGKPLDSYWYYLGIYSLNTISMYVIPTIDCTVIWTERKGRIA